MVSGDPLVSRNLCTKCYKKVISFYIFKLQAIKNDAYLRSQHTKEEVDDLHMHNQTNDKFKFEEEPVIKIEYGYDDCQLDQSKLDIKEDLNELNLNVKAEETSDTEKVKYDNEVLSFLRKKKANTYKGYSTEDEDYVPDKKRKITSNNRIKLAQVCELCGKSFVNLKDHMEQHKDLVDRKKFPCKNCPKIFRSHDGMYKHYRRKHLLIKTKCTICDKNYENLAYHNVQMHKEKMKTCTICEKRYLNQSALDMHSVSHTDERPYQCDVCLGTYKTKQMLRSHIRAVHNQEKPHMCHLCSRSFSKKCHLQIHIRTHTNERPFGCDECGKRFRTRCTLKNHRIIHTGVKSVPCRVCHKMFKTRTEVAHHMSKHSTEKPHSCQVCELRFKRSDNRDVHERNIHGLDRRPKRAGRTAVA